LVVWSSSYPSVKEYVKVCNPTSHRGTTLLARPFFPMRGLRVSFVRWRCGKGNPSFLVVAYTPQTTSGNPHGNTGTDKTADSFLYYLVLEATYTGYSDRRQKVLLLLVRRRRLTISLRHFSSTRLVICSLSDSLFFAHHPPWVPEGEINLPTT
jgi:hypothetical protein